MVLAAPQAMHSIFKEQPKRTRSEAVPTLLKDIHKG